MGCGSSKDEDPNEIKSEMKTTKIANYDDLFQKIGNILEKAEAIRSGLGESTDTMNELAGIEILKEGDFTDSIQAFLWSISANCGGKIQSSNLKIEEAKPYVSLDLDNTYADCWRFQEALKNFITACMEAPQTLQELLTEVVALADQAKDFPNTAKDDATNAGLNVLEAGKAAAYTLANVKTAATGIPKLKNVLEILTQAATNLKNTLPKLPDMISKADEVGEKANKEGHKTPATCLAHYSTKEKKTKEELAAIRKQKEEKEKKKKKKKGNKK